MIVSVLAVIAFVTVQAFQSNTTLSDHALVARSVAFPDKKLYKRTRGSKQPAPAQEGPPAPTRNLRQRLTQGQNANPGQAIGHTQPASGGRGRGAAQEAGRNQDRGRARAAAGTAGRGNRGQGRPQGRGREANQARGRGQAAARESNPTAPGTSDTHHRPITATGDRKRFPSLDSNVGNPSRSRPVHIHTALSGPARIEGHFGQNYERRVVWNVPEGQSVSQSWMDQHMADVYVTTHPENTGMIRGFATGSRRASIRTHQPYRKVGVGHDMRIGGPVNDMKLEQSDFGPAGAPAYIRASTRHGPNHVGVDSISRGPGWQRLRASNSAGSGDSHVSSVSGGEESLSNQGNLGAGDGEAQSGQNESQGTNINRASSG